MASIEEPQAPPHPTPPTARGWRPLLARLHFYAGVLVGPFLLVAALTGGLYALAPTIERVVYRDILTVEPSATSLPLREQAIAAQSAHPDLTMTGLRPAATDTESTRIYFSDPALGAEHARAVFVDPHTGRVLGAQTTWFGHLPLSTWLDGLHRHLNLGEPGRVYSELAASWLWVIALSGTCLWVYRTRRERRRGRDGRLFSMRRAAAASSAGARNRTLNWHGVTGIWLLAALLFLSATGITWSTYAGAHVSDMRAALNWERPQLPESATGDGAPPLQPLQVDYDAVLDRAAGAGVRLPAEITLPSGGASTLSVTETDKPYRLTTNAAAVDPATMTVTGAVDYWRDYSTMAKLADWGIRAHMGFLFGLLNQMLLLTVAVGLLTVIVRGYRMWWQRRPVRGSAWALGRPPRRGTLRRLPPPAFALLVVAAAVGWFLPLLGISLVAFLVIDALIGAVALGAARVSSR